MGLPAKVVGYLGGIFKIARSGSRTQFAGAPVTADALADNQITATAAARKPLVIQLAVSQTANGVEVQNSAGTVLFSIASDGPSRSARVAMPGLIASGRGWSA